MEKNCLVTTYKATVNDNSLLKVGEMRIKVSSVESPNENTNGFAISVNKDVELEIIGDGYFTDETLTQNKGKKITHRNILDRNVFVSNGNFEVSISNKYAINYFGISVPVDWNTPNKSYDIGMLRYSSDLTELWGGKSGAFGDISALSGLTNLTVLFLENTNVSGDISALSGLTKLSQFTFENTSVSGDISSLKNLSNIGAINLYKTKVTGDISSLSGLTNLATLNIEYTNIVGNISSLSNLTKLKKVGLNTKINGGIYGDIASVSSLSVLTNLRLWNSRLTGDLSQMPEKLAVFENHFGNGNFTWTSRSASSTVFSMQGSLVVDNIDGMLNDFSNCVVSDKDTTKRIEVQGTRTSASDTAVADLKSKGYTIIVNGATL